MEHIPEDQNLNEPREKLFDSLAEYREKAENRLFDNRRWNNLHRAKLKSIITKILDLQIEIKNL